MLVCLCFGFWFFSLENVQAELDRIVKTTKTESIFTPRAVMTEQLTVADSTSEALNTSLQ
jgi:hypothetical protein